MAKCWPNSAKCGQVYQHFCRIQPNLATSSPKCYWILLDLATFGQIQKTNWLTLAKFGPHSPIFAWNWYKNWPNVASFCQNLGKLDKLCLNLANILPNCEENGVFDLLSTIHHSAEWCIGNAVESVGSPMESCHIYYTVL